MAEPRSLDVCAPCHRNLTLSTTAAVAATGEFAVQDVLEEAARMSAPPPPAATTGVTCTWCGQPAERVRKLLSSGEVHICNACVGLCADILHAELGDDWRN